MQDMNGAKGASRLIRRLMKAQRDPSRWLIATVAFLVAFVLRYVLEGDLPPGFPFLTFFPAVILTAFVGGLGPGIAVAVASTLASWFFFIPPFGTLTLDGPVALALSFFVIIAAVDLAVIHYMFKWLEDLDREREHSRQLATARDLMFKEMQHRISNNLSVISSLLRMQQRTVQDEGALKALDEAATRLALISKIHRQLHNPDGQQLPFAAFLKGLCHDILEASGTQGRIVCLVQGDELYLSSERAVPVALIIAELVSNSLEHAFVGRDRGTISVDLRKQPDEDVLLTIKDDGIGLPDGFDLEGTRSLGLLVARKLSEQIEATMAMKTDIGASTELRFRDL